MIDYYFFIKKSGYMVIWFWLDFDLESTEYEFPFVQDSTRTSVKNISVAKNK